MKRTITIVGFTQISGQSKKDGKPYNFTEISGLCEDEKYKSGQGQKAVCYAVNNEDLQDVTLALGNQIHVWSHFYNGKDYVDAIMDA